jgi:superfamily II DNA helicase RecQ
MHIHSPEPLKELPISIEKIKKALSNSFLNGNSWYDYQEEYLDKILPSSEDLLVSLPTGAGKSLLFQAPALFKSSFTNKLSIVVTPLKALMEDQVNDLWNKGFINNVEYINSDRKSDIPMIYRSIAGGELSLLYITPERFRSNSFVNALKTRIKIDGSLEYAIFDEAHCVSQWGHDFRPDYLNSAKSICTFRKHSSERFPILLFSATVSEKIYNDFKEIFI